MIWRHVLVDMYVMYVRNIVRAGGDICNCVLLEPRCGHRVFVLMTFHTGLCVILCADCIENVVDMSAVWCCEFLICCCQCQYSIMPNKELRRCSAETNWRWWLVFSFCMRVREERALPLSRFGATLLVVCRHLRQYVTLSKFDCEFLTFLA